MFYGFFSNFKLAELMQYRRPGRLGSVVEDVAEVPAAFRAQDLGAEHAVRGVALFLDAAAVLRRGEARPPASAIELRVALEELGAAARAPIRARFVVIAELTRERALRRLLPEHRVLDRRELLLPLGVGLLHAAQGNARYNESEWALISSCAPSRPTARFASSPSGRPRPQKRSRPYKKRKARAPSSSPRCSRPRCSCARRWRPICACKASSKATTRRRASSPTLSPTARRAVSSSSATERTWRSASAPSCR